MGQAILIMFVAMSLIPAGDTAGKLLSGYHDVDPLFVAWSRFVIGAMCIAPFFRPTSLPLFADWRIWLRGALLAGGITSIQFALQSEPIANVFAAFFVGPIVSYILSAWFLKEPTSLLRNTLMLIGFAGVLIVTRPGLGGSFGLIFAVIAGGCYGAFLTTSRWMSAGVAARDLLFTQLAISAVITLPFGLPAAPQMTSQLVTLTLASGVFSMLGNLLLLVAYARAPATYLAPLVYFQLLAAVLLGWQVFAQLPDLWTWIGLLVVITAGVSSAALRR